MAEYKVKLKPNSKILKKKSKKMVGVKKRCKFCLDSSMQSTIDYKNTSLLKSFLTDCGKILPARMSGNCAACQKRVCNAIKLSRTMALVPFCSH